MTKSAGSASSSSTFPARELHGGGGGSGLNMSLLSAMMFLQYAVWGVWLPYIASYLQGPTADGGLGLTGAQVGWILGTAGSLGAITAPFLAGQVADRFINAEKYLGILLVVGGILQFSLYYADTFWAFLILATAYSVVYMPTLALTNSIAFAHLKDPERHFAPVRLWGTIGWIVASNAFPLIWLQTNLHFTPLPPFLEGTEKPNQIGLIADCLRVSGVLAVGYGIFAMLLLPATPPKQNVEHPFAFARAFRLLGHPGFLVCTLVALPISMIHQVYFIRTSPFLGDLGFGAQYHGPIMSIGQFSEIFFLAILGLLLTRLGYRGTLALGCMAYAVRFGLFGLAEPESRWIVVAANVLHGLCYGCFFAGAYIYVERVAPKDVRHSAQTVFGIIILGLGPILAGVYNQQLDAFSNNGSADQEAALVAPADESAVANAGEELLRAGEQAGADALAAAGEESVAGEMSEAARQATAEARWEQFNWQGLWWTQATLGFASAILLVVCFRPGLRKPRETGAADIADAAVDTAPQTHPPSGRPTDHHRN